MASRAQNGYVIAQTPQQKEAHFDLLSNSISNYLLDPIRLNMSEQPSHFQTEDPSKFTRISGPKTILNVRDGTPQLCDTHVMCAANPLIGTESHEADFLEKIFSIREVMGAFRAKEGEIYLQGANRVLYGLSSSFFDMSSYYSIPSDFRKTTLELGQEEIKKYLSSTSASLSTEKIFESALRPILFRDLGLEEKSIVAIENNFLKLPQYLQSILILVTNDAVPTANMFAGIEGMRADEARIRALNVGPKSSGNPPLSESLNEFATQTVPMDANVQNIVYLYYDLTYDDLSDQQNISRVLGELSLHKSFFTNIFLKNDFSALPQEFQEQAKEYSDIVYKVGHDRGLTDEQIHESFKEIVSDISEISTALNSGDTERGWELLNLFKSKYAIARYYEFEKKGTEFTNSKTPEDFAKSISGTDDFLTSSQVSAYVAASLSLNLVGRLMALVPKPHAKLLDIKYFSEDSDSETTVERSDKNKGIIVTSSSKWSIFVDKKNSIFTPVDEIMIQTGLSSFTNVNKGKNEGIVKYIGTRTDEQGIYYNFSITEQKTYQTQAEFEAHQTKFYAPYTLSEVDPGMLLYEVLGGTKYYEKMPPPKPSSSDVVFESNLSSEHLLGGDVAKTLDGTISVNESALQGTRDVSVAAQGYGGLLLGLKNDVEANFIRSFVYGESATGIVAGYWAREGFDLLRAEIGLAPTDIISVSDFETFYAKNDKLILSNALGENLRDDILSWIEAESVKHQTEFDSKWLEDMKMRIESGEIDVLSCEGLAKVIGQTEVERIMWRAKAKGYESLIWNTTDKTQRGEYLGALANTLSEEYISTWNQLLPNTQAEHYVMGRFFSNLEAMQDYVEQNSAFSIKYVVKDAFLKDDTFFAKLSLTTPIGSGIFSSGGEVLGSTFNFAYEDPYALALRLGWGMPIYENDFSKMDLEVELAGFVAIPRDSKNTEYNENLMGSKSDWASNPGIVSNLMGWLGRGASTSELNQMRTHIHSARSLFEYKNDANGVKLCNDLLGDPKSSDPEKRAGVLNLYLNGSKDERIIYSTIGAFRDFCVENYSGLPTSRSSMFLGTFFPGGDFASYFGSEKIKGVAGAGYMRAAFHNVIETSNSSVLDVRTNFYPTFALNWLKDAAMSTESVGGAVMFRGPESDETITLRQLDESTNMSLPYFFTITSEADWSYELPVITDMAIKMGAGPTINWTALRITDLNAHVDLNYKINEQALVNLRLQAGASKFLYQSDFIPNMRTSLQLGYANILGLPVDAMLNMQYGRDFPIYSSGFPVTSHLENFGINFKLQTSLNRIIGAVSNDAEVQRLHPSLDYTPAQNPTNVRSWRVNQRSPQTGEPIQTPQDKQDSKILGALDLLKPEDRAKLEQYRSNSVVALIPEFDLTACPPELKTKYEHALLVSNEISEIREKYPELANTLTEGWIQQQLISAVSGFNGDLLR